VEKKKPFQHMELTLLRQGGFVLLLGLFFSTDLRFELWENPRLFLFGFRPNK